MRNLSLRLATVLSLGWRLPSVVEVAGLIDPSLPAPFVPGTVFTGVRSALYWSATTPARGSTSLSLN